MADLGLGAGLAALAFWGFIAAVSVATIWDGVRKREARHETLRRLAESGQPIDEAVMDKLLLMNAGGGKRHDQDFKLTALWILPVAAGMAIFGVIMGNQYPETSGPLLGVAALLACLGIGFWVASKIAARWYQKEGDSSLDQLRD
jgi:hypothetical protein